MFGNACRGVFSINVSKVGILSVRLSEAQGNAQHFCKERAGARPKPRALISQTEIKRPLRRAGAKP
jgi:hypothetical protein